MDSAEASIATLQSDYTTLSGNVLTLIDTDTTWNIDASGGGDYDDIVAEIAREQEVAKGLGVTLDKDLDLEVEMGQMELDLSPNTSSQPNQPSRFKVKERSKK